MGGGGCEGDGVGDEIVVQQLFKCTKCQIQEVSSECVVVNWAMYIGS